MPLTNVDLLYVFTHFRLSFTLIIQHCTSLICISRVLVRIEILFVFQVSVFRLLWPSTFMGLNIHTVTQYIPAELDFFEIQLYRDLAVIPSMAFGNLIRTSISTNLQIHRYLFMRHKLAKRFSPRFRKCFLIDGVIKMTAI